MNRAPAFQFYPDKWCSHTRHLSDNAYRIYHELLNWMWLQSPDYCSVSRAEAALVVALGRSPGAISTAMAEIQNEHMPLLKEENGRYISHGLRKERAKQTGRSKQARDAANRRWHDADASKMDADAYADASPEHADASELPCGRIENGCSPVPTPTPSPVPTPAPREERARAPQNPTPRSFGLDAITQDACNQIMNDWRASINNSDITVHADKSWRELKQLHRAGELDFTTLRRAVENAATHYQDQTFVPDFANWLRDGAWRNLGHEDYKPPKPRQPQTTGGRFDGM